MHHFDIRRLAVLLVLMCAAFSCTNQHSAEADLSADKLAQEEVAEPIMRYGLDESAYLIHEGVIKKGQFLADILLPYGVPYSAIAEIDQASKDVYPVTKLRDGSKYAVFLAPDSSKAHYFVVEVSRESYVVYGLADRPTVSMGTKPVTYQRREAYGEINASLHQTIAEQSLPIPLAISLSDIYAWSIDFYRIQKGDWFKVIFTEKLVDGEVVGVDQILAAEFNHRGRSYSAYLFDDGEKATYYDEKGESLRKAFLKAPLEFSRISSKYSMKRYHPVQKRWKAHLGTDYAAPPGTPIMSTGDGTVVESSYGKYNGNFVKVKHNATYSTQYLHMSKRSVKKGDVVRQGQTIGYVGSTGLATGPHVCYRFWKNGHQIDPYSEEIPPSEPVPAALRGAYKMHVDSLSKSMMGIVVDEVI